MFFYRTNVFFFLLSLPFIQGSEKLFCRFFGCGSSFSNLDTRKPQPEPFNSSVNFVIGLV